MLIEKKTRSGRMYYENAEGAIIQMECTGGCGEVKYTEVFSSHKRGFNGRESRCKTCKAEIAKKYREANSEKEAERNRKWREDNKEKVAERTRKWYTENKDRHSENRRRWSASNKESLAESNRKWYDNNKDRKLFMCRKWNEENRDKSILIQQRRRARKRNLPDTLTDEQLSNIVKHFNGGCALTGDTLDIHMDHVIPLTSGHGGTMYENYVPLRGNLNESKNNRNLFDWFYANRERFGLSQEKFDALIEYLADINGMTTAEYEEYVRWCHDNPRTLDEITTQTDVN